MVDLSTAWANAPTTIVLDCSVPSEVWSNIAKTTLPSWVAQPPWNLGSRNHGKLKADQWCTACLVNLVITFCRIWGYSDASEKDQTLLQNYLSLVIAVRWATTRSTLLCHIEIIEQHMAYYIHSTLELFGPRALVFNNHMSFHIPECLHAFGPAHGWWTSPFEWFNGILQWYNLI